MKSLLLSALAAALLLAAGCATPESRIRKNPELFNSLPPDVQNEVRAGRIDVGYAQGAVELALGRPDRVYSRRTQGTAPSEVWSYTTTRTTTDRQRVDVRIRGYDSNGNPRTYTEWTWVDIDREHEYERLRIEFTNGVVHAIESMDQH